MSDEHWEAVKGKWLLRSIGVAALVAVGLFTVVSGCQQALSLSKPETVKGPESKLTIASLETEPDPYKDDDGVWWAPATTEVR